MKNVSEFKPFHAWCPLKGQTYLNLQVLRVNKKYY